jgi:AcrR family transcriptional regulator
MPMASSPTLTPAGQRILAAASKLFYDEGIHAVGVDAIAKAAGVTKKTLYDCFGSKDALVAAYLSARDEQWRAQVFEYVDGVAGTPAEKVLATFDILADWMRRRNPRGCAFVNALAELTSDSHPGRVVILEQKRWLLAYLTELAGRAGAANPTAIAEQLALLHEGATAAYGTGVLDDPVGLAKTTAAVLLDIGRDGADLTAG